MCKLYFPITLAGAITTATATHMLSLLPGYEDAGLAIMFQSGGLRGQRECYVIFPTADPNLQKHIVLQI